MNVKSIIVGGIVRVDMTDDEAEDFKVYIENRKNFKFLIRKGAFSKTPGKVEFIKDHNGVIQDVSVTTVHKRTAIDNF